MSVSKLIQEKYEEEYHTGKIISTFGGFSEEHWHDDKRWKQTAENISKFRLKPWGTAPPSILEIGCGEGTLLSHLREYNLNRGLYVGIDISYYALSHNVNKDIGYARSCASDLPFKPKTFDFVLAFDVLEHLPYEPFFKNALKGIDSVLKCGGMLIITIPLENRDGTKNILESEGVREHYVVMEESWWMEELRKYGFGKISTRDMDSPGCPIKDMKKYGYPYNMSPLNHYMEFVKA